MRTILRTICLLILSLNCFAIEVETPIGEIDLNGHATLFGYQTSRNQFNNYGTTEGSWDKSNVGILATYEAHENISFKWYATTDYLVDYGYVDLHVPISKYTSGLRIGRVNRLSGSFGGFGPHADKMNFLPQATSADRIGRVFYRFDGIQAYASTVFNKHHVLNVEFTYGNPAIVDDGGVFDPAFFAMFDAHKTTIRTNDPAPVINVTYTYKDWEVFADYYEMDIKFDTEYYATWDAETISRMTGTPINQIPEDYTLDVRQPVSVEHYPAYGMSFGISKAFNTTELLYMYSRQVGKLDDPDLTIGTSTVGGRLVPEQHSFTIRQHIDEDMLYGGASYFRSFYTTQDLYDVGVIAEEYVTYGKEVFIGFYKTLSPNLNTILELRHIRGSSFLSSTYQPPLESERVWNVLSVSLNVVF